MNNHTQQAVQKGRWPRATSLPQANRENHEAPPLTKSLSQESDQVLEAIECPNCDGEGVYSACELAPAGRCPVCNGTGELYRKAWPTEGKEAGLWVHEALWTCKCPAVESFGWIVEECETCGCKRPKYPHRFEDFELASPVKVAEFKASPASLTKESEAVGEGEERENVRGIDTQIGEDQ